MIFILGKQVVLNSNFNKPAKMAVSLSTIIVPMHGTEHSCSGL